MRLASRSVFERVGKEKTTLVSRGTGGGDVVFVEEIVEIEADYVSELHSLHCVELIMDTAIPNRCAGNRESPEIVGGIRETDLAARAIFNRGIGITCIVSLGMERTGVDNAQVYR